MLCPECQKEMVILEYRNIELDFCPACAGCWLDQGELGLILSGQMDLPEDWYLTGNRKSKRRCPRCGGKMKAGILPGTKVEVDVCDRKHGFWLDKGELQEIAKARSSTGNAATLAEFISGIFGSDKNRRNT
jgi:hypothetical protein